MSPDEKGNYTCRSSANAPVHAAPAATTPLRIKPGTTRFTTGVDLRLQCKACAVTHPAACEWHPARVSMLTEMKKNDGCLNPRELDDLN